MTKRSNRTRGTRPDNLALGLRSRQLPIRPASNRVRGGSARPPIPLYLFNGVDQYATLGEPWAPQGVQWVASIVLAPSVVDGTSRYMWGGGSMFSRNEGGNLYMCRYRDWTGANQSANTARVPVVGDLLRFSQTAEGDGQTADAGGVIAHDDPPWSLGQTGNAIVALGSLNVAGAGFWAGPLGHARFEDNSPIQDTSANWFNNNNFVNLGDQISLPGDLTIEWDWIRSDRTGTDIGNICGNAVNQDTRIYAWDSNQASTPHQLSFRINNISRNAPLALETIAIGQHCHIACKRRAGIVTFEVDGVVHETNNSAFNEIFVMDQIGAGGGTLRQNGGAFQNFRVTDEDTGQFWLWPLDEGAGSDATDTSSGNDGVWSGTMDWRDYGNRTRLYPMNEGSGNVFLCYDGNGARVPAGDAIIQNHDESSWREI